MFERGSVGEAAQPALDSAFERLMSDLLAEWSSTLLAEGTCEKSRATVPGGHVVAPVGIEPLDDAPDPPTVPWAVQHPQAVLLESLRPGPALVGELSVVEPADCDDAALVEMVAGWERVVAWSTSQQARAVAELYGRRLAQRQDRYVGDEVAARLGITRSGGDALVGLALGLERLPAVADALDAGRIVVRKAALITEQLQQVDEELAREMAARVLPDSETLTPPQLRCRLRRLQIAADPEGAEQRHQRERAERHVSMTPAEDAMAWLNAYLPADEATALFTTLTAVADTAPPGDERPMGARRADALVDLGTRFLDAGLCPDGILPRRHGRRPHLEVTASVSTLLGLDHGPGHLAGFGPIPASMTRQIAARATWRPLLVDAATGQLAARSATTYRPSAGVRDAVLDRDRTCTFLGCRTPAARCDIDHITPFDPATDASTQTTVANLHTLCRHHHQAKTDGRWVPVRDAGAGITRWTSPSGHTYLRPPAGPGNLSGGTWASTGEGDSPRPPGPTGDADPPEHAAPTAPTEPAIPTEPTEPAIPAEPTEPTAEQSPGVAPTAEQPATATGDPPAEPACPEPPF